MDKKYLLFPGHVTSKNDGQEHFISATQLAECYGVPFRECVVHGSDGDRWNHGKDLIHLFPDHHGEYKIPQTDTQTPKEAIDKLVKKESE